MYKSLKPVNSCYNCRFFRKGVDGRSGLCLKRNMIVFFPDRTGSTCKMYEPLMEGLQ